MSPGNAMDEAMAWLAEHPDENPFASKQMEIYKQGYDQGYTDGVAAGRAAERERIMLDLAREVAARAA